MLLDVFCQMRMDFRHIANFISCSSPDSVEDLSASSPISEDDVVFVKVSESVPQQH